MTIAIPLHTVVFWIVFAGVVGASLFVSGFAGGWWLRGFAKPDRKVIQLLGRIKWLKHRERVQRRDAVCVNEENRELRGEIRAYEKLKGIASLAATGGE